jgi:hypothetical protein
MKQIKVKNYKHFKEVQDAIIMPKAPYWRLIEIDQFGNFDAKELYLTPEEAVRVAQFILDLYGATQ